MKDAPDHRWRPGESSRARWLTTLANSAGIVGPSLLFGLRLWASVSLALYVAFRLELDSAYWAGTSAAVVCQPHLGASLRKAWFRMIGTLVGAVVIVVLTALFPQDRLGFLVGLALWGAACALVATLLRNFAAYAAALAGYTAAIIASDQLGVTGGPNGEAFMLAITRVSEIWIGIVSAGIVLAGTDLGDAPLRLTAQFAALAAEIAKGLTSSLGRAGVDSSDTLQPVRRELIRRVIALDPVIDESIGESSRLRYHSSVLQAVFAGLFTALAGWRSVVTRLAGLPKDLARQEVSAVMHSIPRELWSAAQRGDPASWMQDPSGMHDSCERAIRSLTAMPADTPSLRLLADQTAAILAGFAAVLDGLALLVRSTRQPFQGRGATFYVADWLPALVNGGRAFVTISALEMFWIISQWPNGAQAITFGAITVILLAPRAEEAYARAVTFMVGTSLAAVCAAIVLFAGLPNVETFAGFSMVMALYLVPVGTLGAMAGQAWPATIFAPLAGNFVPLLAPANQMTYDTAQFYNSALAIVAGCGAAALSFRLLPPLPPVFLAQRLLELTLRDLRRLATDAVGRPPHDWERRIYSRLAALPDQAEPLQRARLLAALSVGSEVVELRRIVSHLGFESELDAALAALAQGNSATAIARLIQIDRRLASRFNAGAETAIALRARGRALVISEALSEHASYFGAGESV